MNNKLVKIMMLSLVLVWIMIYATEGIAKAIWPTKQYKKYRLWIFAMVMLNVLISFFLMLSPYQLFGQSSSDGYYSLLVTAHITYLIVGCGLHVFSQVDEKKIVA
ncbi:hypothetical protein [Aquirufa ecclesiirivi]|uniref:Uncharacterized protein n=1 Tax=Aquirufa ecclesiirivi TaxID=2715124 RepID=A0ABT4JDB7_9BACT|nr:hypothetical protein [Aquirufa ecclesiirivi]MCZ2472404.1 hypothetical protein [Aquirufa ecclesiirivi]MCZ2473918.1 hypothetical protein [Aquirufa ecclesiirivi]MDF0694118.1 hypothetical protein [Aquirufa ecclesiirivi]